MVAAYSSGARFESNRFESENLDWVRKEYLIYYIPFDLRRVLNYGYDKVREQRN